MCLRHRVYIFSSKAISLIELVITCAILIITFVAFIYGAISCFKLVQLSKETFFALHSANAKLEEIRDYNFAGIYNYYQNGAGHTFEVAELPLGTSKGSVTIDNTNPELLIAYIAVCWRSFDGRIIGEDKNLNGDLDPGEDTTVVNNKIDSPVTVSSYIVRR